MVDKCHICKTELNAYEKRHGNLCAKHVEEASNAENEAIADSLQRRARGE